MASRSLLSLRHFAHEHDDLPVFHAAYFILALLAAGLLNMGAFGLLIVAHMSLDVVKYREVHGYGFWGTLEGIVRESLADIALFFLGFFFAVYLHHSHGVIALSGVMRAEVTIARTLLIMLPKFEILHHFFKAVVHMRAYFSRVHPRMQGGLSVGELCSTATLGLSVLMVVLAPRVLGVAVPVLQKILLEELIPWKI